MIHAIGQRLHDGIRYVVMHPQFSLTLLLIVIIPLSFLISGQKFLDVARGNQKFLERERIGMLHDIFVSRLESPDLNIESVKRELLNITEQNPDIVIFLIIRKEANGYIIFASKNLDDVGTVVEDMSKFQSVHTDPERTISFEFAENGIRFWQSYRLASAPDGEEYYIYTQTSLENVDRALGEGITQTYYLLGIVMIVILFLLYRHMKLIDYSYLYRETKQANEMKDMFTNMIAHELRAPLTAMKGYASMVRERQDIPDDVRGYGQKIEDSAGRLVLIINDLLDVARIHSGKLTVKPTETNVQDTITSVLEIMKKSASEKDIVLSQEVIIPDLRIHADPMRLHQALTNLVSNSIKYTKSGSITLAIEDRDDRIEIRVKDTGSGISAENQQSLFKPFFRVSSADVDNTVGTGLGMWITKQLIELMKGSIAVESIKGVGTHIVVTLPK